MRRIEGNTVKLERLAKDAESNITGCQAVYLGEAGPCVVQGDKVDQDTFANLENVLPGEGAVFIKPEVLIEAARCLQERLACPPS